MARDRLSFQPTIAKPCEESWAAMTGNLRERHCERCQKHVHNFAGMTPREIENLVHATGGKLCARITRRGDGSLVTLEGGPRASFAAQMVASATLAIGAAGAMAQSSAQQPAAARAGKAADAVLTGTVLVPDGSGPVVDGVVSLRDANSVVVTAKTDSTGNFRIAAQPGTYDVLIRQSVLFGTRIYGANLHEGEQSLQSIKTHFSQVHDDGSAMETYTTMGDVVSIESYSLSGAIRHPLRYLRNLIRKR